MEEISISRATSRWNNVPVSYYLSDNAAEKDKAKQAADCCRKILNHVNQAVKESEDKQV